jgi:hypothetical protein
MRSGEAREQAGLDLEARPEPLERGVERSMTCIGGTEPDGDDAARARQA